MIRCRAVRARPPGVRTLAVWNRPLSEGRLFWEAVGVPRLEALRSASAAEPGAVIGRSLRSALVDLHRELSFDAAFLGGGLLCEAGLTDSLVGLPFPVTLAPDPVFVGEPGGRALLATAGREGVVIDIGQTSVKASWGPRRTVVPRDLDRLPRLFIDRAGQPPRASEARTRDSAQFVASALGCVLEDDHTPAAIVLALPCPLDDALVPGGCTYGWEGDARLVPAMAGAFEQLLASHPAASPDDVHVFVVNDAELAAVSARALLTPAPGRSVLCLTLGFGPGATLLTG